MASPPARDRASGLGALLGVEVVEVGDRSARARLAVRDELRRPDGALDGGVFGSMAQAVCLRATEEVVARGGSAVHGLSNQTWFLQPIRDGHVNAVGRAVHSGRTTWVWTVDFHDDAERLCALSRVTVAVASAGAPVSQPR